MIATIVGAKTDALAIQSPAPPPATPPARKSRAKAKPLPPPPSSSPAPVVSQPSPATNGPTLVICPTSAMMQWNDEITRATRPGTLRVLVFYQDRGKITKDAIEGYDVVLTTYQVSLPTSPSIHSPTTSTFSPPKHQVLENEYRKCANNHKKPCEYCGRMYLPKSLVWHNKYFCGPNAMKTEKQGKQVRFDEWSEGPCPFSIIIKLLNKNHIGLRI